MTSHLRHLQWRKTQELSTTGLPGGSVHLSINMGYIETLFNVGTGKAEFVGQSQIYFSKTDGFLGSMDTCNISSQMLHWIRIS